MERLFDIEVEQLSLIERDSLTDLERTIERGLTTFVEVGNALMTIKDSRLYRQHGTFEEYCRDRWGMERAHAYRLIDSAQVIANLSPMGDILPTVERQIRPLTRLEPEEQREVWQRAVETARNGKVTAAHVQRVADEHRFIPPVAPVDPEEVWEEETPTYIEPAKPMAVHYSSETPEHYTPFIIVEAALNCLGSIDLDPCSNSHETPNVPAQYHLTADDNGLEHPWIGKVYMNPPYGREIGAWVNKLCDEYEQGNATEAIALVPARTDTQWFLRLRNYPVCFVEGRLTFIGNDDPAPFPSAVFYLGSEIGAFYRSFCDIGDIWQRIEPEMFGE